ncbi:hypothetical protein DUI87_10443 [Hirundo rustica rustica]|uniref:Uncharacterized protein n=1 Tax=Hirundo rustica rustica TaxID=333673 RepID=A0A3M0KIN5_HIRRU|nr:hypothetical protein DUI87_10443 [Hirundo rustica rustica]
MGQAIFLFTMEVKNNGDLELQEFILPCCAQIPMYEMEIILSNSMISEPDIIIIAKPKETFTTRFYGFNALKINNDYIPLPSENKTMIATPWQEKLDLVSSQIPGVVA